MAKYTDAHKATRLIGEAFESHNYRFDVQADDKVSVLKIGFTGKSAPGKDYYFFSMDEDNDVTIRSETIVNVPEDRTAKLLGVIAECNDRFRYVKFFLDSDNDIAMGATIPMKVSDECLGEVARGYLLRMVGILDEAYPILMRAIWAD